MVELAVVGGGYWGICATYLARNAGVDAVLIDDGNPLGATRNSAGICQRWWYRQEVASRRIPSDWDWQGPQLDWLDRLGLVRDTGEMFFTPRKPDQRRRPDCLLVNPWEVEALVEPVAARVRRIERGVRLLLDGGDDVVARKVLVTAGAWTDVLLDASGLPPVGVTPLRGRAYVVEAVAPETPVTFMPRPYTHYTLRAWGPGRARIGDTVERKRGQLGGLSLAYREITGHEPDIADVLDGLRPVADRYICDEVAPGVVVATGGHRVGLGLAEPVARRALRLLGLTG